LKTQTQSNPNTSILVLVVTVAARNSKTAEALGPPEKETKPPENIEATGEY